MTRDDAKDHGRKLLGDRIAAMAEKTGVAKAVKTVERVTGWDCGCAQRRAALNRWDGRRRV